MSGGGGGAGNNFGQHAANGSSGNSGQHTPSNNSGTHRQGDPFASGDSPADNGDSFASGNFQGVSAQPFSLLSLFMFIRTIIPMALMIVLVTQYNRFVNKRKRQARMVKA